MTSGRRDGALRTVSLVVASLVAASLAVLPVDGALANGRFPTAEQLVVAPTNPDHLAVQTTYGFIQTTNAGKNWGWTCEDAALYGGVLDPPIGLMSDETLIAGVFDGLVVSSQNSCNYAFAGNGLENRFVIDVAAQKSDPTKAIAVSSNGMGGNTFDTRLWETSDNAKSWAQAGIALPPDFLALTSDVSPSDPQRIYVSGFRIVSSTDYQGAIARTNDRGATWEIVPVTGSDNSTGPYIGAIDPLDTDTLYVRLTGDAGKLLVSRDAGDTWDVVYQAAGKLLGFALSPDGQTLLIGGESDGVQRAATSDLVFTQINATVHVRCLTWAGDTVYACGREAQDQFTIGKSLDQGVTFEAIQHLSCLDGPIPSCPAGTDVADKCAGPWAITKQTLQTDTCPTNPSSAQSSGAGGGSGDGDGASSGCCSVVAPRRGAVRAEAALLVAAFAVAAGLARRGSRPGAAPRSRNRR